uniref:H15 domain-containing protein n=1 Tax=Branchiostoma floridae TaxID=7739 RepID=C3Y4Q1_BRAFL|eukprot:XP_002608698.1 hypothetical protein BRAFLDRAFT_120578 [Branchiostoma floridae]
MSSLARRKTRRSVSRKQSTDTLVSQRPLTLETVENVISKLKDPKGATVNAILLPLQTTNPGVPVDELKALLKAVLLEGLDSGRLIRPPGSKARRGLVGRFLLKATDSADSSLENAAETLVNTAKRTGVPKIDCVGHNNDVKGEVTKKTQKKRGQRRRKSVAKASEDHVTSSDGHDIRKTETDKEDKSEELQVQEDVKLRTRRSKKDTVQVQPTRSTAPRGKSGRKPAKTVTAVETVTTEDDATEHQIERKVKEEENGVPDEERASEQDSTGVKEDPPSDLNGTFVLESSSSPAAYLQRVQQERERLAGRCLDVEKYLRWKVPSNVLERVRSAIGQCTLITTNKKSTMARFEGQCQEAMVPEGDNPYRPTMNDLEAYWDLVELQVKNIDQLFDHVHVMVKREAV